MPANYSKLVTRVTGQTITASEQNNEHDNHINNAIPSIIDDYSATSTEMQTTADPYPASVISQPTNLAGELARLRYQLQLLTSDTYWYQDPTFLAGLNQAATPGATAATLKARLDHFAAQVQKLNGGTNWYDAMAWLSALNQAASPGATATDLKNRLDQVVTQIKALAGTTNWYDAIAVSLVNKLSLAGGTMSGALAMGSQKITGLANGTASTDAAAFGQLGYRTGTQGATSGDFSTTSATAVTITGCTVSVTPVSTSSRIKLSFAGLIWGDGGTADVLVGFYKNGALLRNFYYAPVSYIERRSCAGLYIDSPSSVAAITYDVRISIANGNTAKINDGTGAALVAEELYA